MSKPQLYPPIIKGVLPAFYLEYSEIAHILKGGKLVVPFNMNASVSESQFAGFSLRIRTASTSSYVLPPIYSNSFDVTKGEVIFNFSSKQATYLVEGQYYKIQIAYCASEVMDGAGNFTGGDIGYYSTVGIAKCTSKPKVTIKDMIVENVNLFNNELFGLYDLTDCKDRTEKVYSYEFKVYDEEENIFLESGEILHQASYDTDYTQSIDRILLNDFASTETVYSIQYIVHTINGLDLASPMYRVSSEFLVSSNDKIEIIPSNDTENGIVTLHFKGALDRNRSYYFLTNIELFNKIDVENDGTAKLDDWGRNAATVVKEDVYEKKSLNKLGFLRSYSLYKYRYIRSGRSGWQYTFMENTPKGKKEISYIDEEGNLITRYYNLQTIQELEFSGVEFGDPKRIDAYTRAYLQEQDNYELLVPGTYGMRAMTYEYVEDNCIDLEGEAVAGYEENEKKYYGTYLVSRASEEDNYTTWFNLGRIKLFDQTPSKFIIKDTTVEHGRKYRYALQQCNVWGLYSARITSDIFVAKFEDMLITDGDITLKIKYNPEVSSFKATVLEQKTDTIGGRFPFITRNGATNYKEFPISGLLAQEIDDHHYFVDPEWGHVHRHSSSAQYKYNEEDGEYYLTKAPKNAMYDLSDYSDYTMALERNFKLKVLEWLNNGKPKLFRSPQEGNYIVRLMQCSLSPIKELGRKLHSFQCQAYEIAECTYENLINFGFLKLEVFSDAIDFWKSYNLADDAFWDEEKKNVMIQVNGGIQAFIAQDMMPQDIIYLKFDNELAELPVMIGITGSYTYNSKTRTLQYIRVPASDRHKLIGIITILHQGVRLTDFDSIIAMKLRTIVNQQYIGVSPWLEAMKRVDWIQTGNDGGLIYTIAPAQYSELQNYNIRTYLDKVVKYEKTTGSNGNVIVYYRPSEEFKHLIQSFDPGDLLEQINLSIHQGEKYKTEMVNLEILRFRERPLIPVYTHQRFSPNTSFIPGSYQDPQTINEKEDNQVTLYVSTTPYGYPHPIEHLMEYEMLDPYCMYEVFVQDYMTEDWIPLKVEGYPYYDPYYRTWTRAEYDPTVGMNVQWKQAALLESYSSIEEAEQQDKDLEYDEEDIVDDMSLQQRQEALNWEKGLLQTQLDVDIYNLHEEDFDNYLDYFNEIQDLKEKHNKEIELLEAKYDVKRRLILNKDCEEYAELSQYNRWEINEYGNRNENVWMNYLTNQKYLMLKPESRRLYRHNAWHQLNKKRKAQGLYVVENPIETEMYDYELIMYKENDSGIKSYFYTDAIIKNNRQYKDVKFIKENDLDLFYRDGQHYYAIGTTTVKPNTSYYIKEYDVNLNLSTEKEITYRDPIMYNAYHIGNGVIAELTFQLRVIDYYTEIYNDDVREAKERYLETKNFYTELMNTYTKIDLANVKRLQNRAFMELYSALLYGNKDFAFTSDGLRVYIDRILADKELKKELYLHSLYKITMINDLYDADAIELLLNYKDTYKEQKEDLIEAFSHAEVYYYYEQSTIEIIDEYYIIDNRWYKASDDDPIFYIKDKNFSENSDDVGIFRYKNNDGNIYFYKVNKNKYFNAYGDPSVDKNDLTIIYDSTNSNQPFRAISKYAVIHTGESIYELIPQTKELTTSYLDLLNSTELAAVEVEDFFLCAELVTNEQNQETLYEEEEINNVLNNVYLIGAENKLEAINAEIHKMNTEVEQQDTTKTNLEIAYVDKMNTTLNKVNEYNHKVYKWWCAQAFIDLTNTQDQVDWMCGPQCFNTTESQLVAALLTMCKDVKIEANTRVSSGVEKINRLLKAASNLYDLIVTDAEYVASLDVMIEDIKDDDALDNFLTSQYGVIRGKVTLQFYAMYYALEQSIQLINNNEITPQEGLQGFKDTCVELIQKYNYIKQLIYDYSNNKFKVLYRDITELIKNYYNIYLEYWNKFSVSSELELNLIAQISNSYDDITFLLNNISTSHDALSLSGIMMEGIAAHAAEVTTTSSDNILNIINGNNHFINIFTDRTDKNIFQDRILNMSVTNKQTLNNGNYKDIETYPYRSSLIYDNIITNRKNIFNFFILNPLSDWYFDVRLPEEYQNQWNPNKNNGNQTNSGNIRYFNTVLSDEGRTLALEIHNILLDYMIELLGEIEGTTVVQYRLYVSRNYNITLGTGTLGAREPNDEEPKNTDIKNYLNNQDEFNLFKIRKDIMSPQGEVGSLINSVITAQEQIRSKYTDNYIMRNFGDSNFKITDINILVPDAPFSRDNNLPAFNSNSPNANHRDNHNFAIPYDTTLTDRNEFNMGSNWYQPIYIDDSILKAMTSIIEDADTKNLVIDNKGIYWEYLDLFYQTKINSTTELLNQAKTLQRLYAKQTDIYVTKYNNYLNEHDYYQAMYASYFGTDIYRFYQQYNRTDLTDYQKEALIKSYKDRVYQAWWDFMNLLDTRYSAEKESGMYL